MDSGFTDQAKCDACSDFLLEESDKALEWNCAQEHGNMR